MFKIIFYKKTVLAVLKLVKLLLYTTVHIPYKLEQDERAYSLINLPLIQATN